MRYPYGCASDACGSFGASVAQEIAQNVPIASLGYLYGCASDACGSLGASVSHEMAQNIPMASVGYPYGCASVGQELAQNIPIASLWLALCVFKSCLGSALV